MKKFHCAVLLTLFATVVACKKSNSTNTTNAFIINGISDVNMPDSTVQQSLQIALGSGTQEQVTLSLTGLPAGITAAINPNNGIPTFGSTITYTASQAALGTYPIKLTGITASGASKVYSFNLVYSDCASQVVGDYGVTMSCDTDVQFKSSISKAIGVVNRINISNFAGESTTIYADVNCGTNTFTIPTQTTLYSTKVSGAGTINKDSTITITYTEVSSTQTINCIVTYKSARNSVCASSIVSSYNYTSSCTIPSGGGHIMVSLNGSVVGRINFEDFMSSGESVVADVDCATNTLTIPLQHPGGGNLSYQGTGTFTANHQISISFTKSENGNTQSCTAQFQ